MCFLFFFDNGSDGAVLKINNLHPHVSVLSVTVCCIFMLKNRKNNNETNNETLQHHAISTNSPLHNRFFNKHIFCLGEAT